MKYYTVTEVLAPWGNFERIPPAILEAAAQRGTEVHQACASIASGLFPVFDPELEGYVNSFRLWFATVDEVILCEERLADADLGFSGQIDLYVKIGKHRYLVDLKTPVGKKKSWQLQMAGYFRLLQIAGHDPDDAGSLRLKADGGTPRMDWYEQDGQDLNLFLQCLNLRRFFS